MSEIRDRALLKVFNVIESHTDKNYMLQCPISEVAGEIIDTIPELAIVDREAELPKEPEACGMREQFEDILSGYRMAQTEMLKGGWVKEIKDEEN